MARCQRSEGLPPHPWQIAANHSEATESQTRSPLHALWALWGSRLEPGARWGDRRAQRPARRPALAAVALLLVSSGGAAGDEALEVRLAPPGQPEWQAIEFARIGAHTRYEVVSVVAPDGEATDIGDRSHAPGGPTYHSHAECAASGMLLPIEGVDLEATPVLSWSWKIAQGLDIADEKTSGGDDFAARVYALYRFDRSRASLLQRVAHDIAGRLAGRELPGASISYVWASRVPIGESWTLPGAGSTIRFSLRSDSFRFVAGAGAKQSELRSAAGWQNEHVDLLADYARLVREGDRPELAGIAIMTDSDDTCQEASALFGPLLLSARTAREKSARPGSRAGSSLDRLQESASSVSSTHPVPATREDAPPKGRSSPQNPRSAR